MKIETEIIRNCFSKKNLFLFIIEFIFINLIGFINSSDTSLINIKYFNERKNLYYVNAMNNNNGDLFFEFWGEENNIRYFIGINATTGEDIYFNNNKIYQIAATSSSSIYHESIIINNNNENNIFSMNYINFDFINLKEGIFTTKSINQIFDFDKQDYSSFRNCIFKLKNGDYIMSIILYKISLFNYHNLVINILNFNSNNMAGYQKKNILKILLGMTL